MFHIQLQQHSRWSINLVTHWLCPHVYIQTNSDHSSHQSLVIWTTVIQKVYLAQNLRHSIPFSHQQNFIFYTTIWLYLCVWNTHFLSTCHIIRPPTFIHTVLIQFSLLWFITNSSTDIHFLFTTRKFQTCVRNNIYGDRQKKSGFQTHFGHLKPIQVKGNIGWSYYWWFTFILLYKLFIIYTWKIICTLLLLLLLLLLWFFFPSSLIYRLFKFSWTN